MLRYHIRKHYRVSIPHNKIHEHLKEKGYTKPNPKKQRKRKRCRYERKHSIPLIRIDWFEYDGKVIIFQDDTSRCILAIGEFEHATGKNSISILKEALLVAESVNGTILAVNTDRGSQFYANKKGKKGNGKSEFEKILRKKRNQPHTLTEK